MAWQPVPVETDPDAVAVRLLRGMRDRLGSGWTALDGHPEVALAEEIGRENADTNARVRDAFDTAFAGFGISLHGLPALLGFPATLPVQVTLNVPGATIPAGFQVVGRTADGVDVVFTQREAATAATTSQRLTLTARDVGALANGVPTGPLQVITATAGVVTVEATAPSAGGVDPETLDAYVARLADYISILRPGAVRADDVGPIARSVNGVARALAVDLYDADTGTAGAERTVSVFPVGSDGLPVSTSVAQALRAALEAVREVNFRFRLGQPTYTPVHVAVTATARPGADPVAVAEAVRDAVLDFLSPARWGAAPDDLDGWQPENTVRYLQLSTAAGGADGVRFLTSFTINGGTADVKLPGIAALPAAPDAADPTTVAVTITAGA